MFRFIKTIRHKLRKPEGTYAKIVFTEEELKQQKYKRHLGGGEAQWESRGAFQLFFLKRMGLLPSHRMLDLGCGPIRAGGHIIRYLDTNMYHGVDYNKDFIHVARGLVEKDPLLAEKKPVLEVDNDFGFTKIKGAFDYALVFSVLNHCSDSQKTFFFNGLHRKLNKKGKIYITHALWFKESMLSLNHLKVTRTFSEPSDIAPDLKMEDWGWAANESIFPILELMPDSDSRETHALTGKQ